MGKIIIKVVTIITITMSLPSGGTLLRILLLTKKLDPKQQIPAVAGKIVRKNGEAGPQGRPDSTGATRPEAQPLQQ